MVLLSFMKREKEYVSDHEHTLLWLLPAGAVELRERDVEQDLDEGMSMHGWASSEVVPLKGPKAQTCSTNLL